MRSRFWKLFRTPWFWGLLLVALMIQSLPMMLCMPLTADPVMYDLQAQCALQGGILYRDIVEPNLPGVVWLHMAIRSSFGWSTMALRLVDLAILTGIVLLLLTWHRSRDCLSEKRSRNESIFLALMLFWFYFGTSEWCHCQRDIWLLLPAMLALYLRRNQIAGMLTDTIANAKTFRWGILEGIVWAVGFWLKPFIVIPAISVIALGVLVVYKLQKMPLRKLGKRVLADFSGILLGGLLIGALGTGWLMQTGTWPYFLEMILEWNPTYFEVGSDRWTWDRLWREQLRFMPFSLFHMVAIPLALAQVIKTAIKPQTTILPGGVQQNELTNLLLCGLYLGWMLQSFTMQHLFDYVHVSEIFLGITLVVRNARNIALRFADANNAASNSQLSSELPSPQNICLGAALMMVSLALYTNPATDWNRVRHWSNCVTQGSTPEVKDSIQHFPLPAWAELQPALDHLSQLQLKDCELTVHNVHLVHVYRELNLKPSTRFVYLDVLTRIFYRDHAEEIVEHLDRSGHRYVLSGLIENGMSPADVQQVDQQFPHRLPSAFPQQHLAEFPYHFPVVFRSGQYVIYRVDQSVAPLNPAFMPLAMKPQTSNQKSE